MSFNKYSYIILFSAIYTAYNCNTIKSMELESTNIDNIEDINTDNGKRLPHGDHEDMEFDPKDLTPKRIYKSSFISNIFNKAANLYGKTTGNLKNCYSYSYNKAFDTISDNPHKTGIAALTLLGIYNLNKRKNNITRSLKNKYTNFKDTLPEIREELEDVVLRGYYDLEDFIWEEGLTDKQKINVAAGTLAASLSALAVLNYKSQLGLALDLGKQTLYSALKPGLNLGKAINKNIINGVKLADNGYVSAVGYICRNAKEYSRPISLVLGTLGCLTVGHNILKAIKRSSLSETTLFLDSLTQDQWAQLLKRDLLSKDMKITNLLKESEHNPNKLKQTKSFMAVLTKQQKEELDKLISKFNKQQRLI